MENNNYNAMLTQLSNISREIENNNYNKYLSMVAQLSNISREMENNNYNELLRNGGTIVKQFERE